eukprot:114062-Amphidinium_carterae.1
MNSSRRLQVAHNGMSGGGLALRCQRSSQGLVACVAVSTSQPAPPFPQSAWESWWLPQDPQGGVTHSGTHVKTCGAMLAGRGSHWRTYRGTSQAVRSSCARLCLNHSTSAKRAPSAPAVHHIFSCSGWRQCL